MKQIKVFKYHKMNEANAYLLINQNKAILIDGGFNSQEIDKYLLKNNLTLTDILITHFHADHVAGLDSLAKKFNAIVHINENDFSYLLNDDFNGTSRGCLTDYKDAKIVFDKFNLAKQMSINGFKINFIFVGGHTPGSSFYAVDDKWLFVGDTLFKNGLGFHNKKSENLREELRILLKQTCDDNAFFKSIELIINKYHVYKIYPGHWEEGFFIKDILNNSNHPIFDELK